MTTDLYLAAYSVVLTWVMVFSAAFWRSKAWSPAGMMVAFGNREDVAPPTGANARAILGPKRAMLRRHAALGRAVPRR